MAILAKSHESPLMEQHYRIFKATLANMRRTMRQLEGAVPAPVVIEVEPGHPHFRYVERLPLQAIVMKLARLTAALHSSMVLHQVGQLQDLGAIQRIVDEQNEDVCFLCHAVIKGALTARHNEFLKEFWQEELENIGTPQMRSIPRHRVSREQIRAYLANLPESGLNQSTAVHVTNLIGKTFSGYIHGAGSHIMELYGGDPTHFHVEGMAGTPLWSHQVENQENYFHRSSNSFGLAALAFDRNELVEAIRAFRQHFESELGMDYFDAIAKKHGRKYAGNKAPK
jgi:hypothetical protein